MKTTDPTCRPCPKCEKDELRPHNQHLCYQCREVVLRKLAQKSWEDKELKVRDEPAPPPRYRNGW